LRAGIRVVLVSSQFPDTGKLADWLGGEKIESDWTPTWLQRFVYHRSEDHRTGLLQGESGQPEPVLDLKPSAKSPGEGCVRDRPAEAAALAKMAEDNGLVVIYTNEKSNVARLLEQVKATFGDWDGAAPELLALAGAVELADPDAAALLRNGIGVHHGDVVRITRQGVETAARKNLLRCVVCTPTLLEGVDFPTRTVIAAYPPWTKGKPQVARLRNLAGRAGRGGRYTSGTLIVMAANTAAAKTWLKAFRTALPATRSGLERALDALRNFAKNIEALDIGDETRRPTDAVDGIILAAVAEGATTDGDLRTALEDALGRTLWFATTHPNVREYTFAVAAKRASYVRRVVGDPRWSRAFYRSGLPLVSCTAVRDALLPHAAKLEQALDDPIVDVDAWLLWLATDVAPRSKELATWSAHPPADIRDALGRWLRGDPADSIAAAHPALWHEIEHDLDTLVPWVLTGAVEIAAAAVGRDDLRDIAHRRLGISRLRYGVPRVELCDVVRRGHDRTRASELAVEYDRESWWIAQSLTDYVIERSLAAVDESEEPF